MDREKKLIKLTVLREENGLSQQAVATFFALKSRQAVGSWELGTNNPARNKRQKFIVYLLDKLQLRKRPEELFELWDSVMVDIWGWAPLNTDELRQYGFSSGAMQLEDRKKGTSTLLTHSDRASYEGFIAQFIPRSQYFVGRVNELATLKEALQPGGVVTICGPGGVGKTALVAEVLHILHASGELLERFPDGIITYDFSSGDRIESTLEHINDSLNNPLQSDLISATRRILAQRRLLIILEGAELANTLQPLVEIRSRCHVLILSRQRKHDYEIRIDIWPLPLDDAVVMLQHLVRRGKFDLYIGRQVCQLVGGLPLAIDLIGRYLNEKEENLVDYYSWLQETPFALLKSEAEKRAGIDVLIERSVSRLNQASKITKLAMQILRIIGRLENSPLKKNVFIAILGANSSDIGLALGVLIDHCLLRRIDEYYQASHSLIHTFAQVKLGASEKLLKNLTYYFCDLLDSFHISVIPEQQITVEKPHILALLRNLLQQKKWELFNSLAEKVLPYLNTSGQWISYKSVAEMGVRVAQMMAVGEHNKAFWLGRLGHIFTKLGKAEQAIEYHEQALGNFRLLEETLEVGEQFNSLGAVHLHLGKIPEAIRYYGQALEIFQHSQDKLSEQKGFANIGEAYLLLGQEDLATSYLNKALTICDEQNYVREKGIVIGHLASVSMHHGDFEQSTYLYQQAIEISRNVNDRRSEEVYTGNLADIYLHLGQLEKAIDYSQRALILSQELKDMRNEGVWWFNLGEANRLSNNIYKALEFYQYSLVIAWFANDGLGKAYGLNYLGLIYSYLKQYKHAISLHKQALVMSQTLQVLYLTIEFQADLASAYLQYGEIVEAKAHIEGVLENLEKIPLEKTESPIRVALACYRVLRYYRDPFSQQLLRKASILLGDQAKRIKDENLRRHYFEIALHQEVNEELARLGIGQLT